MSRRLPVRLRWAALAWVVAEIVVFMLLVRTIGLGATLLLGLITTVLGVLMLRRTGVETLRALRRSVGGVGPGDGALLDGLLAGLGGVLLVIPGFLANAAGLALQAPSARRALARRFAPAQFERPRRPAGPSGTIDLSPDDWTPIDRT